jgi:type IV pilus assembly protein PilX
MKTISSCLINQPLGVGADKYSRSFVSPLTSLQTQTGVVLVISLIILLLLTLIGLSAIQTSALEEKMVGNLRDKSLAFQAAESALRAAELSLPSISSSAYVAAGTGGFYLDNNATPNPIPSATAILKDIFWSSNPVAISTVTGLGNGINSPAYIVQKLSPFCYVPCALPPQTFTPYKITVRATGGTTNTVVILQSIKFI